MITFQNNFCAYLDAYFYRAALNAGRSSHEKAVCPSVRLSVCLSVRLSNACIVTKRTKRKWLVGDVKI